MTFTRHCFRFRLTTMLLGIALLSLPLTLIRCEKIKFQKQAQALDRIRTIQRNQGGIASTRSRRNRPFWANVFGQEETAQYICEVEFNFCVTNEALFALKDICNLTNVTFYGTNVTDDGIQIVVENVPDLEVLSLHGSYSLTDAAFRNIAKSKNLSSLNLDFVKGISDDGIQELCGLRQLSTLSCWGVPLTDRCMRALSTMQSLRVLVLRGTSITDSGVAELCKLTDLESLDLTNTNVTDISIPSLRKLRNLKTLSVHDSKMSDKGIDQLREMVPDRCEFFPGGSSVH